MAERQKPREPPAKLKKKDIVALKKLSDTQIKSLVLTRRHIATHLRRLYRDHPRRSGDARVPLDAHRSYRARGLKPLAIKYDCSVTDLKKKVKNLRSAFHRKHKRITKPKSGSSPKKEKWFAYNLLSFLLDVDIPRETFSTAENSEEEDNAASEMSTSDTQNTILPTEGGNEGVSVKHFLSPKKRAKTSKPKSPYSKREEEAYIALQQAMKKDECTTYGEHVGNELRALQPRARTIVKHLINNILFEAAMGKYNEKPPTSQDWNLATTSSIIHS
ncbi:hypothetical protein J6590_000225 [Homalodisca vitripennis]|nr:hypothetical protein J6590_000225 [Homalodisca vitripennis]